MLYYAITYVVYNSSISTDKKAENPLFTPSIG